MAKPALSRTYSLGCPQLDREHEALFSIMERFEEALSGELDFGRLEALKVELAAYFDSHHQYELALMERTGFPEIDAHIEEHREARRKFKRISAIMKDNPWAARALFFVLKGWMATHMTRTDGRLAKHLNAHLPE